MNYVAIQNYYAPFAEGMKIASPVTTPKMYGQWLMNQSRKKLKGWQKELKRNRKHKH